MIRTSVIVPTFDRAALLAEALDSILVQCGSRDQIIVVDDGSTDGTSAVLGTYGRRIDVVRQARGGSASARNAGLRAATGDRIAFLDADDLWDVRHDAVLHAMLDRHHALDLAFGHVVEFTTGAVPGALHAVRRLPGAQCGAVVVRRRVLDQVGPFRTDLRVGEFIDWMARARRAGFAEAMSDETVLHRRLHAGNMTRRESLTDYAKVVRAHLAARRDGIP